MGWEGGSGRGGGEARAEDEEDGLWNFLPYFDRECVLVTCMHRSLLSAAFRSRDPTTVSVSV